MCNVHVKIIYIYVILEYTITTSFTINLNISYYFNMKCIMHTGKLTL